MDEVPRLILMLVLAGAVLTLLGALAIRLNDEARRVRRGLKKVLGAEPHALIVARGRGRGAGFDFGANRMAVAWDTGEWCLIYRIDELIGAELILDGQVAARAHRGEARRALDVLGGAEKEVRLRLIFDDPRHPEFVLVLWQTSDEARRGAPDAEDAVQEANRWIARVEALLRRPLPRREAPAAAVAASSEDDEEIEEAEDDEDETQAEIDVEDADAEAEAPPWEDDEDEDADEDERIA
ncbi:hypothetical protein [Phenylobacterium sp.]|jgi:hypothetical protein|uniref:hypothetical protein n=1 Tax=Phenylobacterium sp. TaxID=1871053 RepID=UPI002F95C908